jgi:phosphatidyl-myo-inositol dimannoside synthase
MNLIRVDRPVVVHTHGFEVGWARIPAVAQALKAIGKRAALVTVISEYTRRIIERALGGRAPIEMLRTGVDLERFSQRIDGGEVRKRFGLAGAPVVVCVSRLVKRKGQDTLIAAMPRVIQEIPDAKALIVGGGPYASRLDEISDYVGLDVGRNVIFAGEIPDEDLPQHYAAGDVFAMPCRSRFAELEVEGLGIVFLEAQACGRPAIAGDSGGAPEAVLPGETGFVVPGRDHRALAARLIELLGNPQRASAMGQAGRSFVERNHNWDDVVARYRAMLGRI